MMALSKTARRDRQSARPIRSAAVARLKERFYANIESPRRAYRNLVESFARESDQVLDFGCGYAAPDLQSLNCNANRIGLDVVDAFRRADAPNVQFVHGNAHQMPFEDASFDLVMCRSVLEHIQHPSVVFSEIRRVLRPGGHFVFLTPNRWDYVSLFSTLVPNRMHPALVRHFTGRAEEDTFPTYYRANDSRQLRRLASTAQLRVEQLVMLRGHPHYLQFSTAAYALGVLYENTVERCAKNLRPWILGVCQRKRHEER